MPRLVSVVRHRFHRFPFAARRGPALHGVAVLALATTVAVPVTLSAPRAAAAQASASAPPASDDGAPTLYERLGGFDFIAGFVDVAFPRVASHPELSHLFGGHSMDSQLRQRQLVVELLCQHTGGPCIYIGRPLRTAHEGLGITSEDWETFMTIIHAASDELGVPAEVRADWIALWEGFRESAVLR